MPANLKYSTAAKNGQLTDLNTRIGVSCKIALYDGTQPASPNVAVTTQVKLCEWTGNAGGFGSVSAGVLTAAAVVNTTGLAASNGTWFRISTSGAVDVVDGSAGTSASDMILNTATVSVGLTCAFNSLALTAGN